MPQKKTFPSVLMPIVALRGLVLFPNMVLHFDIGREKSIAALDAAIEGNRRIYLVAQRSITVDDPSPADLYSVGVVAEIKQVVRVKGDAARVMVEGLYRAKARQVVTQNGYLCGEVSPSPVREPKPGNEAYADALMRTVKDAFEEYAILTPKMPKELLVNIMMTPSPLLLGEHITANIPLPVEEKQAILVESDPLKRLERLAAILERENEVLSLEQDIYERVKDQMDKNQREYYLREQMKIISSELGEGENPAEDSDEYAGKIKALKLSAEGEKKLLSEAARLGKLPPGSQEAAVVRGYLDTCLELPWNTLTKDKLDIAAAAKQLDNDHYGLVKVKERILEAMAVRALTPGVPGQVLCLVGPPGVGKTSVARSIAKAMGRKYVRVSLGGVRDEADIRGHRKTYVGSMPGRILAAMKLAGSKNPLMLLDEVDKLANDARGDPASALLEVLDSEQNNAFRDHFLEIPFDLSQVLFIATANDLGTVSPALRDRMEIIELSSYTREEKFQIAKRHLLKKQRSRHGLTAANTRVKDDVLYALIDYYTREAGVRSLERQLSALMRKSAKAIVLGESARVTLSAADLEGLLGPHKYRPDGLPERDEVGVSNGLAWTSVGGEMLQVEVAVLPGSGKVELTGSLGSVMKESAQAVISFVRSRADRYAIDHDFYKTKDLHFHLPEGAVPKDGPSAGIALCTALVSALTGMPVRRDVAMTGEMTLRGRVLAIGGLKEKTMAAYRAGVATVLIPQDNVPDLAEIDPVVRGALHFVPVETVDPVLELALLPVPPAPVQEAGLELPLPLPAAAPSNGRQPLVIS